MENEEKVTLEEIENYPNLIFNLTKVSEEQLTTALYADLSLLEHLLNSNLKDCFSDNRFEILVREVITRKIEDNKRRRKERITNNDSSECPDLEEQEAKVSMALVHLRDYYSKELGDIIK